MNIRNVFFIIIYTFILTANLNALENKILFKIDNEIITTLDILNELKYLESVNNQFKNAEKTQAYEIAKRSLVREKIKEIELRKVVKEIKIENEFLENLIINYFKKKKIKSISDFENYFTLIGIDPSIIKKKVTIEVLWNQLIFNKYNQNIKIDKQNIINEIKRSNIQKQYLLSEILFNVNENEKLEDKFNLIKNKIDKSNFSEAALTYSVSDTSSQGGKLGWINESALSKKIKHTIQNITIGNYSDPIVIPGGFLILKIFDIREKKNNFDQNVEIEKIIKEKTNKQLNQFSIIYFNKIKKNISINEL